jgi:hypothetical protein
VGASSYGQGTGWLGVLFSKMIFGGGRFEMSPMLPKNENKTQAFRIGILLSTRSIEQ